MIAPSADQIRYVRDLQKRLAMPDWLLDQFCREHFERPFAEIDYRDCSRVLDTLLAWKALPAKYQRAKGQRDLPGFEGLR